jgi:hypothetical protein
MRRTRSAYHIGTVRNTGDTKFERVFQTANSTNRPHGQTRELPHTAPRANLPDFLQRPAVDILTRDEFGPQERGHQDFEQPKTSSDEASNSATDALKAHPSTPEAKLEDTTNACLPRAHGNKITHLCYILAPREQLLFPASAHSLRNVGICIQPLAREVSVSRPNASSRHLEPPHEKFPSPVFTQSASIYSSRDSSYQDTDLRANVFHLQLPRYQQQIASYPAATHPAAAHVHPQC